MKQKLIGGRVPSRLAWFVVVAVAVLVVGVGVALAAGSAAPAGWPAAKARLAAQQQQALALARSHPRPKLPAAGLAPASQPPPRPPAGIVAMQQGPFPATTFTVRDVWQGPVGADWVLAYAGATPGSSGGPPTRGALRLYGETADLHLVPIGTFPAAAGTGPLTITGATGTLLRLRTDSGTTLSFNLGTHQYQQ